MKYLINCILSVLLLLGLIFGVLGLITWLGPGEWHQDIPLTFGYLPMSLLVILVLTGIGFLAAPKSHNASGAAICMPVLRPVPIPTRQRSLPGRIVVWLHDIRIWEVAENWQYTLPNSQIQIVIHQGFRFDGASVPRPIWAILSPTGLLLVQGLIHDYAYRYGQLWQVQGTTVTPYHPGATKAYWDRLFQKIGREVNGMSFINCFAYLAVYLGGHCAWRCNRRINANPVVPPGMHEASDED